MLPVTSVTDSTSAASDATAANSPANRYTPARE